MSPPDRAPAAALADELAAVFAAELEEQLRQAARVLPLSDAGADEAQRRRLSRIFHTIKGGAGLVGRGELAAAAESLEHCFAGGTDRGEPDRGALALLFAAAGMPVPELDAAPHQVAPQRQRAVFVDVGAQRLAVPLAAVQRAAVVVPPIGPAGDTALIEVAGVRLRLIPLHARLAEPPPRGRAVALVMGDAGGRAAVLLADRVGAPCDVAVTGLADAFAGHALVCAAALEPDGRRVRCVLDVERLLALAEPPPAAVSDPAVLVVDDSRLVRSALGQILDNAGIGFDTAADGREALVKLERRSFALVLTDLEMPEMDGYELLERLRADARWRSQPVVVCSSRIDGETPRLRGLDVAGYIAKPFQAEAVLSLLRRFVGDPQQALQAPARSPVPPTL